MIAIRFDGGPSGQVDGVYAHALRPAPLAQLREHLTTDLAAMRLAARIRGTAVHGWKVPWEIQMTRTPVEAEFGAHACAWTPMPPETPR